MFDNKGFIEAINTIKQLPRDQWMDFVKNKYKLKNQNFSEYEQQGMQLLQSKNAQLPLFTNMISSQFGIKF